MGFHTLFTTSVFFIIAVNAAFYDCAGELELLRSDEEALPKIKAAFEEKMKFPSHCLEALLRKNFFQTADFLMKEYYPKTSIDTQVIVRNVANEIKRN